MGNMEEAMEIERTTGRRGKNMYHKSVPAEVIQAMNIIKSKKKVCSCFLKN